MNSFSNTDDTQEGSHTERHRLTQTEFRIRQQQYKSDLIRTLQSFGILFVFGGAGFIVLFSFQPELHLQEYKKVIGAVALASLAGFAVWIVWRLCVLEKLGPKCPACQVPLAGLDACITMATRSCPKCYVLILLADEELPDTAPSSIGTEAAIDRMTADDLDQKMKSSSRLLTRLATVSFWWLCCWRVQRRQLFGIWTCGLRV